MVTIAFHILVSWFLQTGQVVKNNGEIAQLRELKLYQKNDIAASLLVFKERDKVKKMELSRLRRVNLKEPLKRTKGVTSWLAILVEKDNTKHEVVMDMIEVRGINSAGKEEVISANSINKITF